MPEYSSKGVVLEGIQRPDGGQVRIYPIKQGTSGQAADSLAEQIGPKYGAPTTTFAHEQEIPVGSNKCTVKTPGKLTQEFSEKAGLAIPHAEVTCRGLDGIEHTAKVPSRAPQNGLNT